MCRSQRWLGMMVVSFILSVVAGSFCPLALGAPSKTLIRDAGLILTMDHKVGTGVRSA
jgi:5-methylthioadenosine/S-adenosylhomocysteine deaminase